jgi:hypothetical protein
MDKQRVGAFVERWRTAQERGDFNAYSALYAKAFTGIKRVGAKMTRFDRKGWMADRREMFRSDMRVVLSGIEIFTGERSAFVTFVQDWSTPRYHDVGKKRLDLVQQNGELLIEREEMLASETAAVPGAKPPPPDELALLWPLRRGFGVVLRRGQVKTRGPARRVQLSKWEQDYYVEKDVAEAAAGPFVGQLKRKFDLYDGEGVACSATVSALRAVGGYTSWEVDGAADEVWNLMSEHFLIAELDDIKPGCKPLWARAADLPPPTLLRAEKLAGQNAKPALDALSRTSLALSHQKAYEAYLAEGGKPELGSPKTWEALAPTQIAATSFTDPTSKVTYAVAERSAGQGCGEFSAYALGFFKVAQPKWFDLTGNGDPTSELPERPFFGVSPSAAIRTSDGRLLMIAPNVVYADAGAGFVPILTVGRQRSTCGC